MSLRLIIENLRLISLLTSTLIFFLILPAPSFSEPPCPDCQGWHERPPYGAYCPGMGWYGARRPVKNPEEAMNILRSYFPDKTLIINILKERRWGFIAEIRRPDGTLIDVVIVDRRTGRIRSIY